LARDAPGAARGVRRHDALAGRAAAAGARRPGARARSGAASLVGRTRAAGVAMVAAHRRALARLRDAHVVRAAPVRTGRRIARAHPRDAILTRCARAARGAADPALHRGRRRHARIAVATARRARVSVALALPALHVALLARGTHTARAVPRAGVGPTLLVGRDVGHRAARVLGGGVLALIDEVAIAPASPAGPGDRQRSPPRHASQRKEPQAHSIASGGAFGPTLNTSDSSYRGSS